MRGRQQKSKEPNSPSLAVDFAYLHESFELSECHNNNLLDQAFIVYSDEDMISLSSQSHNSNLSFDSRSVALSHRSHVSQHSNKPKSEYSNGNILGNLDNEESSINDVRENQCSQSQRQLMHALEPLLKDRVFLRRSPRFATYDQSQNGQQTSAHQKPFKFKKTETTIQPPHPQMIEDEKFPLNQITQILQQKQEQHMLLNNTTCSIMSEQKRLENDLSFPSQIFPSVRQTRSSKRLSNIESQSTYSNNSRQTGRQGTNEYLSKVTKDYILTTRKEKKIKKAQKQKSSGNSTHRGRQPHVRSH